jgi:hypothetical protein
MSELPRIPHPVPALRWHRRPPSQLPHRRLRVRNPLVAINVRRGVTYALNNTATNVHSRTLAGHRMRVRRDRCEGHARNRQKIPYECHPAQN